jgi:hypothetical protein
MKQHNFYIIFCFVGLFLNAQQEFHVFPKDNAMTRGSEQGNGSIENPWDLQTALSQKSDVVNSDDIIWLHEGIYNGQFISSLNSLEPNKYITVSGYKNDNVILNGNVESTNGHVLQVTGKQVIYKNFEITCLGDFSRDANDENFRIITGIEHTSGEDCKFINLKIYNNPGLGVGSWKHTGGTLFDGCIIYNNGYISKDGKGYGEGLYTQNISNKTRVIQNCILFNNYYKGIEVWSANKKAKSEYVKNYDINNNVLFNNGSPAGYFKDNLIIATGDRNGVNIAKNITVTNNIFYHNTDIRNAQINGDAASLTIGFNENAPVENVKIKDNVIIGRNNALRILHAKSLTLENNKVYSGYVSLQSSTLKNMNNWAFKNNVYYTKKNASFRISGNQDYNLEQWQSGFGLDQNSTWGHIKKFDIEPVLSLLPYSYKSNTYKAVLFQKEGEEVTVDLSKFTLAQGSSYKIYDIENPNVVLKSGVLSEDSLIIFPMQLTDFDKPLHNSKAEKTESNFGVFILEFEDDTTEISKVKKKDSALKRFFKWLGF